MISVDYDLNANYKTDAVYFGTVEHGSKTVEEAKAGASYDDVWDGQLYRIGMREPDGTTGEQKATTPTLWKPSVFFNANQPITAAPSVGTDRYNYWIYFGTGRFFDAIDKPDSAQQSSYGIKELTDCTGEFTWPTFGDKTGLVDVSRIMVRTAGSVDLAQLYCLTTPGDLSSGNIADKICLPESGSIDTLGSLITYIAGSSTTPGTSCVDSNDDDVLDTLSGKNGWYRDFPKITRPRERNLGQATLLGGLLTFTSYQPFEDPCQQEGLANLYGLYYQTGTAWYKTVFGSQGLEGERVLESIPLGLGLATTPNLHVGSGDGPTAFVQTSTGEIIELPETNLPYDFKTGRQSWRER
jgi:type IV pilus assembly protein PilY1